MESDFQNKKDALEDVQDANRNIGNDGNLRDSMSSGEWEDALDNFEEKTETEAAALEASGQMSQAQMTEGAVGGAQQQSQAQMTEGAVGGAQQQSQAQMTEGAVGGTQQSEATGGAVGGSLQNSHLQTTDGVVGAFSKPCSSTSERSVGVLLPEFPRVLQEPTDPSEDHLQLKFIKQVKDYEGAPVAPGEYFELQWTVYQEELQGYLSQGLLPQDTVASAGIDVESYKQMQQCSQELQDQLFDGNLLQCLGNLRGFRRIFSRSRDPYLCHAFRGNPLEVLQNIYYGGEGILPEDRMLLDDPFHYTRNPDGLDD